ncbi:hypothetical protein COCC4DRAFT_63997 [Bipolaris maydis ATCC 48331]|uniref:Uncharacterized protein n=2 Tax=Cochliobolus heterostrophus TaxID=5016 RepID=M2TWD1_COCH5|nr:uncharacterized protein COCC4DRAFT_63997 [Bipolaris maydis ATCC 48331]EMD86036.1 hypothetical protein COCHEDRAFT_1187167 [Bipolaris maydis C5]ENI02039.1 hypothetical protein COCC4DRAFT_63997 [Bipolaris maydis ATCC 48331]KAJ5028190.1 hypothetical protein J3E73DRAFT_409315 [Bipolaris maydis]
MVDGAPTASSNNTSNGVKNGRGPIPELPTEEFDLGSLVACFRDISDGKRFQGSAVKQLLSSLLETNMEPVAGTIEQKLKEKTEGRYAGADINALGDTFFQSSTTSAEGLWALLKRLFLTLLNRRISSSYRPYPGWKGPQNNWFFSIKYYYVSFGGQDVYPGQESGPFRQNLPHLRICRGSSSVALSFSDTEGANTAAALPWRLLILSCDREHSLSKKIKNGVEAFFWGINSELRKVRRRLLNMATQISSICVPPDEFLFNNEMQKSLAFENESLSNSQTYFWALQSLRLINECITWIIREWDMYDKESLLDLLNTGGGGISHTYANSDGEAAAARTASVPYLDDIQEQMTQFAGMIKDNNAKLVEIRALRDGLFDASSFLEARTAVAQGKNIHMLTLISMVFLPASFATSIFGMQSLPPSSTSLTTFAIVMICVCGPVYLIILVLSGGLKGAGVIWGKIARFWDVRGNVDGKKWLEKAKTIIRKKSNKPQDVENGT